MLNRRFVAAFVALVLTAVLASSASSRTESFRVASVYDGDTLTVTTGAKVRLLQIDTPELGSGECYSRKAATELKRLAPRGAEVSLVADPSLDERDRFGRLLRYVFAGSTNINLELVRIGAAAPYFYRGERGRYSTQLYAAARAAKAAKRGLWGACPRTTLDPERAIATGQSGPPASSGSTATGSRSGKCDPSYPTVCIPPAPPDLDCGEIEFRRFKVLPPDPHGFDGRDNDGVGCES